MRKRCKKRKIKVIRRETSIKPFLPMIKEKEKECSGRGRKDSRREKWQAEDLKGEKKMGIKNVYHRDEG